VKNTAHFLLLATVLASAVVLRARDFNLNDSQAWVWDIRWNLALILVAGGAIAVAILQFMRRAARSSRIAGAVIAIAAACLYSWIPRDATAAISAAFSPAKDHVTVRLAGTSPAQPDRPWNYQVTLVSLPLALDGAAGFMKHADLVSLEIVTADGSRYRVTPAKNFSASTREEALAIVSPASAGRPPRADLYFTSPRVWDRVRLGTVTLRGRMIVEFAQEGAAEIHCRRSVASFYPETRSFIEAECDTVELAARNVRFAGHRMTETHYSLSHFPADPWLSPVHRSGALYAKGAAPVSPKAYLPRGFEVVDYMIPNLDLNRFVVRTR
jgi:hypothetical protein